MTRDRTMIEAHLEANEKAYRSGERSREVYVYAQRHWESELRELSNGVREDRRAMKGLAQ